METKIEPDAEILDALDFEPRCESSWPGHGEHDHAATNAATLECRHVIPMCDPAKARALAFRTFKIFGLCPVCGLPVGITAITPLGHRS